MAAAFLLFCAHDAIADDPCWLFWTVDFNDSYENEGTLQENPAPGWKGAQVWLVAQQGEDESTRAYLSDVNGNTVYTMTEFYPLAQDWMGEVTQTDISAYSDGTYSFFVEMGLAASGSYNGYYMSDVLSYDDLVQAGHVTTTIDPVDVTWNPAVGNGPWQAPEPSGGLLTLVGTAILMLRRRRLHLNSGSGRQA